MPDILFVFAAAQLWSLNVSGAVETDILPTKVIGHDVEDVRFFSRPGDWQQGENAEENSAKQSHKRCDALKGLTIRQHLANRAGDSVAGATSDTAIAGLHDICSHRADLDPYRILDR